MRSVVCRAVVLGTVVAALWAPGASAGDYEFLASNGTRCTLTLSHTTPANPDGTYDVSWLDTVTCRGQVEAITLMTSLNAPPDQYWPSSHPYIQCVPHKFPCGPNQQLSLGGTASGVPAQAYTQSGYVTIGLAQDPVPAVFVSVPTLQHHAGDSPATYVGCSPGKTYATCSIRETFEPE